MPLAARRRCDLGRVDGEAGDVDLAAEDEGEHLDADFDLGGLEEGLGAEGGIVGYGGVLGDEVAGEDGEVEFAEGDLAAEGGGEGGFDAGAEGVGVEEERDRKGDEQDEGDDTAEDDQEGAAGKGHRTSRGRAVSRRLVQMATKDEGFAALAERWPIFSRLVLSRQGFLLRGRRPLVEKSCESIVVIDISFGISGDRVF